MIIDVRGVNTRNKGAELMLRAIASELGEQHDLAVEPRAGSFEDRLELGLRLKVGHPRVREEWFSRAHAILPARARQTLRSRYGLIFERDVDAVVDASGFAYSDQFDLRRSLLAAEKNERAKKKGKPVILMPQALGPFVSEDRRKAFCRIVANSDLVYAREPKSLEYAQNTGCAADKLRLAPDFTCLLDGEVPSAFDVSDDLALVVPSKKILTAGDEAVRGSYLTFLVRTTEQLLARGFDVRILVHERNDVATVNALRDAVRARPAVVQYASALHLKGILGTARIVVGSRFHALVSSLSQGVPSLGVGWSHKYEMLFADYGCEAHVVDPRISDSEIADHLDALSSDGVRAELVDTMRKRGEDERAKARVMWREVHSTLGTGR
jgi:colanic acid/amylovoran biosynthesis protein